MRNMVQASLSPGIGSIEYSNISVDRGTTRCSNKSARLDRRRRSIWVNT
jgi:hypothetical protein